MRDLFLFASRETLVSQPVFFGDPSAPGTVLADPIYAEKAVHVGHSELRYTPRSMDRVFNKRILGVSMFSAAVRLGFDDSPVKRRTFGILTEGGLITFENKNAEESVWLEDNPTYYLNESLLVLRDTPAHVSDNDENFSLSLMQEKRLRWWYYAVNGKHEAHETTADDLMQKYKEWEKTDKNPFYRLEEKAKLGIPLTGIAGSRVECVGHNGTFHQSCRDPFTQVFALCFADGDRVEFYNIHRAEFEFKFYSIVG